MPLSDSIEASRHLAAVSAMAARLAPRSIAVFRHTYEYLSFGSWSLVVGNRHRRLRLQWDGKEGILFCAISTHTGSSAPAEWNEVASAPVSGSDPEALFSTVEQLVLQHLASGGT